MSNKDSTGARRFAELALKKGIPTVLLKTLLGKYPGAADWLASGTAVAAADVLSRQGKLEERQNELEAAIRETQAKPAEIGESDMEHSTVDDETLEAVMRYAVSQGKTISESSARKAIGIMDGFEASITPERWAGIGMKLFNDQSERMVQVVKFWVGHVVWCYEKYGLGSNFQGSDDDSAEEHNALFNTFAEVFLPFVFDEANGHIHWHTCVHVPPGARRRAWSQLVKEGKTRIAGCCYFPLEHLGLLPEGAKKLKRKKKV